MSLELGGCEDAASTSEALNLIKGEMVSAELVARYRWAGQLAVGKRVLDAGCGIGHGSEILRESGAEAVTGVDRAASLVESAVRSARAGVSLEVGDIRSLPMPDSCFDLVVAFGVIADLDSSDSDAALDELTRVLAPGGVLVLSWSAEGFEASQLRVAAPSALASALSGRFSHVELVGQSNHAGSLVGSPDGQRLVSVGGVKSCADAGDDVGGAARVFALAGDRPVAVPQPMMVLGGRILWEAWMRSWDAQQAALDAAIRRADSAEAKLGERGALLEQLVEAERLLAEVPRREEELRTAIAERDYALEWARTRVSDLEKQFRAAQRGFMRRAARAFRRLLR